MSKLFRFHVVLIYLHVCRHSQTLAEQTTELPTLPQQKPPVLCACVQNNSSHCCPLSCANHSKASSGHESGISKAVTSPSIFEKKEDLWMTQNLSLSLFMILSSQDRFSMKSLELKKNPEFCLVYSTYHSLALHLSLLGFINHAWHSSEVMIYFESH